MARLIICVVVSLTIAFTCVYGQDDPASTSTSTSSTDAPTSSASSTDSSETTTQSSTTTTQGPIPHCPFPSNEVIYFPVDGDCTKFWECYEGDAYLYSCPPGLWWNPEVNQCDFPGSYCDNPLNFTCPFPSNETTYFPYPGDCTKFIECFEGTHFIGDCPGGLWWHPEAEACDEPGYYCSASTLSSTTSTTEGTSTTSSTTTTTESPTTTSTTESTTPTIDTPSTASTTTESPSTTSPWTPPTSTITPTTWPPSTTTQPPSTSPSTQTTSRITTTANPEVVCPDTNDILYFPYPDDCAKYWECLDGTKTLNNCAPGLWWNPNISDCDTPGDYCTNP